MKNLRRRFFVKPIKENIEPINLSAYEDSLLDLPYFDKSQGYGAWIKVLTQSKGGKVTRQNLWDTANPSGRMWDDGFLSYEEAYGKTFLIPFYLCDSPGSFVVEVKNRRDFKNLKETLWAPLRNEERIVHVCGKQESPPTNSSTQKPSSSDLVASLDLEQTIDEWKDHLGSSLASVATFASGGLLAMAGTGLRMGIEAALQGGFDDAPSSSEEMKGEESENEDVDSSDDEKEIIW
jgi:hypothetical protein